MLGVEVMVRSMEPFDAALRQRGERTLHGLTFGRRKHAVIVVGRNEQHRERDVGKELTRPVLPEPAQDLEVSIEGEPRSDRAVGKHLEVAHLAVDSRFRPIRMS